MLTQTYELACWCVILSFSFVQHISVECSECVCVCVTRVTNAFFEQKVFFAFLFQLLTAFIVSIVVVVIVTLFLFAILSTSFPFGCGESEKWCFFFILSPGVSFPNNNNNNDVRFELAAERRPPSPRHAVEFLFSLFFSSSRFCQVISFKMFCTQICTEMFVVRKCHHHRQP